LSFFLGPLDDLRIHRLLGWRGEAKN
jgi:hypothetical protein